MTTYRNMKFAYTTCSLNFLVKFSNCDDRIMETGVVVLKIRTHTIIIS